VSRARLVVFTTFPCRRPVCTLSRGPQSPSSPHSGRHKSDASSPWKSHLANLKRAKEEVSEAQDRAAAEALRAAQVSNGLAASVARDLAGLKSETEAAATALRSEMTAQDGDLAKALERQLQQTMAEVAARMEGLERLRADASGLGDGLGGLSVRLEAAKVEVGVGIATIKEHCAAHTEAAGEVSRLVSANAATLGSVVAKQHELEGAIGAVEDRLDGKVVSHMGAAFTGLRDSFLEMFEANNAAADGRADATDALVASVGAAQEADRARLDQLEVRDEAAAESMRAFASSQKEELESVLAASAAMTASLEEAVAAASKEAPAPLRFSLALAVWAAAFAIAYAFLLRGVPADGDRTVY